MKPNATSASRGFEKMGMQTRKRATAEKVLLELQWNILRVTMPYIGAINHVLYGLRNVRSCRHRRASAPGQIWLLDPEHQQTEYGQEEEGPSADRGKDKEGTEVAE
jgi:hypothetical protein